VVRRTTILLLELVAGIVVGVAILAGLAVWRLSSGPVSLSFLNEHVIEALSPDDGTFRIGIDDTIIVWAGWDRAFDVRATGVRALNAAGDAVVTVPEVSVRLSLRALLEGTLAPKDLDIFGARLMVARDEAGEFSMGLKGQNSGATGEEDSAAVLEELLAQLTGTPGGNGPFGYLERVGIVDGVLEVEDAREDAAWTAGIERLSLLRAAPGLTGEGILSVSLDGRDHFLAMDGAYDAASGGLSLSLAFEEVPAGSLAGRIDGSSPLVGLSAPISGRASIALDGSGILDELAFELRGGEGSYGQSEVLPDGFSFESLSMSGSASAGFSELRIEDFFIDLGGPTIGATASLETVEGIRHVTAHAAVRDMPVDGLGAYWPDGLAENTRSWMLANLSVGTLRETLVSVEGRIDEGTGFEAEIVKGSMGYENLSVQYIEGLPLVEGVNGRAAFDENSFDLFLDTGRLSKLTLHEGTINLKDLSGDTTGDFAFRVSGPITDTLWVIDHAPLNYAKKLNVEPSQVQGEASFDLTLSFPLIQTLLLDDIRIGVEAELSDVSWRKAMLDLDATEGQLHLALDNKAMVVDGRLRLGSTPAELHWKENFPASAPIATELSLRATVDDAGRAEARMDFAPYLTGPTPIEVDLSSAGRGGAVIDIRGDLTQAVIALDDFGWTKERGVAGSAEARLTVEDGALVDLPALTVVGGGLRVDGDLDFAEDSAFAGANFAELSFAENRLSGTVRIVDDGYDIRLRGESLYASPFFEDEEEETGAKSDQERTLPPLNIDIAVDHVTLGPERNLGRTVAMLQRDSVAWRRIVVEAEMIGAIPDARPMIEVRFVPTAAGQELTVLAADAGLALRSFDLFDDMVGGTMAITGKKASTDPDAPLEGKVLIENYHIVNAPALARILTLASLIGMVDTLSGKGIEFDQFNVPFVYDRGVITIKEGTSRGSEIGLTLKGTIDTNTDTADLDGLVVPAYTINSILAGIPLLGDLLVGEKGGGIFAATYSIEGPLNDPDIGVNPLAALTPGFLRNIFNIFDGKGAPAGDGSTGRNAPGTPGQGNR
jgi:hypothetical protein